MSLLILCQYVHLIVFLVISSISWCDAVKRRIINYLAGSGLPIRSYPIRKIHLYAAIGFALSKIPAPRPRQLSPYVGIRSSRFQSVHAIQNSYLKCSADPLIFNLEIFCRFSSILGFYLSRSMISRSSSLSFLNGITFFFSIISPYFTSSSF